jgi:hypothetical protein
MLKIEAELLCKEFSNNHKGSLKSIRFIVGDTLEYALKLREREG